ncbi:uncharacterized protein LOC142002970 [Carettochelys insculpta]|uniref:uncharacterized protein LOC142002970 n=1 Tax=Carettochelys insculpta TaxID=44489 RepID=UPI003EB8F9A9
MATGEQLLRVLQELKEEEFKAFKFFLHHAALAPLIPYGQLDGASCIRVAELLKQTYPREALEITGKVLHKIPRMDLVQSCWRQAGVDAGTSGSDAHCSEAVNSGAGAGETGAQENQSLVSEQQLMKLAGKMGRNWKQIGIEFLGLEDHCLDRIELDNPSNTKLQVFQMLMEWRKRAKQGASTRALYIILSQDGALQPDALSCLLNAGRA